MFHFYKKVGFRPVEAPSAVHLGYGIEISTYPALVPRLPRRQTPRWQYV